VGTNPFDPQTSGTLSEEEQAEYDRLEALEQARTAEGAHGTLPEVAEASYPDSAVQLDDRDRDVPAELDQSDPDAEQAYPVQNGAVKWDDAANEGDTSRQAKAVYDTPWGRRELSAEEVTDFGHQGVAVTRVDEQPRTSLQDERDEMSKVDLDFKPEN
jgi:hypothetical protein